MLIFISMPSWSPETCLFWLIARFLLFHPLSGGSSDSSNLVLIWLFSINTSWIYHLPKSTFYILPQASYLKNTSWISKLLCPQILVKWAFFLKLFPSTKESEIPSVFQPQRSKKGKKSSFGSNTISKSSLGLRWKQ